MATPREPPWTTHDKNELLAEIIKLANPAPQVLLEIIQRHKMVPSTPRWEELPLPRGHSLSSCRNMFQALQREPPGSATPGSLMSLASPSSASMTFGGKRPFPYEASAAHAGRQLAPKPPSGGLFGQGASAIEQPPKKKRGRPTKAETEARKAGEASAVARQVAPTPLAMAPAPSPLELRETIQTPTEAPRAQPPVVSRMNISSMLASTPTGQGSASHSSSSSGKRRRGRSTRSEPGDMLAIGTGGRLEQSGSYESPYATRAAGEMADSPARAAVLRRREDMPPEQQQQSGGDELHPGYPRQLP